MFRSIDAGRWELCGENPVRLLQEASGEALDRAVGDPDLLGRVASLEDVFAADLRRPPVGPMAGERPIAFLCAEYGVHQSLPIYSGGLGALAGDLLKEASDRALPLVAVGLMYRQGYFRQRLEVSGWQQEYWIDIDPERLPAAVVRARDGQPLLITVPIRDSEVRAQIWCVAVGRVPLFLLDADLPENGRLQRWMSSQLYVADPITRLSQYALLGIGGVRALAALGIEPAIVHLNEGHAAFAALELARGEVARGASIEAALEAARQRTVFTTRTPVAAGNETFPREEVIATLGGLVAELGIDPEVIVRMGRDRPDDGAEPFGVTQFSLRMSRAANGASRRHGAVAREMWRGLWPERAVERVPVTHVTNGVHLASWVGPAMRRVLDRHLGEAWWREAGRGATWDALERVPDAELWQARREQRAELVQFVRERSGLDRLAEHQPRPGIEAAARAFDPDVLTIGFARRNATYKRLRLLIHDPGRALALLATERPVQFILAGKAHPSDNDAKRVVQELFGLRDAPHVAERVVYMHEYDLGMAARLRGCDLWLNLPRPPLEASGTSGMKAVINGGLHLSVLDGWWAEAYDGSNGWAIAGNVDPDPATQDARDADTLFSLIEQEVLPAFYDRDPGDSRARGSPASAPRCAPSHPRSVPGACSTTTSSGSTRQQPTFELTIAGIGEPDATAHASPHARSLIEEQRAGSSGHRPTRAARDSPNRGSPPLASAHRAPTSTRRIRGTPPRRGRMTADLDTDDPLHCDRSDTAEAPTNVTADALLTVYTSDRMNLARVNCGRA